MKPPPSLIICHVISLFLSSAVSHLVTSWVRSLTAEPRKFPPRSCLRSCRDPKIYQSQWVTLSQKVTSWWVGGWTNPIEKYARQIGSYPQGSGWKFQKLFELPPPRWIVFVVSGGISYSSTIHGSVTGLVTWILEPKFYKFTVRSTRL